MDVPEKPKRDKHTEETFITTERRLLRSFELFIAALAVTYGVVIHFGFEMNKGRPINPAFLTLIPLAIGALSIFLLPGKYRTLPATIKAAFVFLGFTLITATGFILCVIGIAPLAIIPMMILHVIFRAIENLLNHIKYSRPEKPKRQ